MTDKSNPEYIDSRSSSELVGAIEALVAFQRRLVELSSLKAEIELFERAHEILRRHFPVPFFQVILREGGRYVVAFMKGVSVDLLEAGVIDDELIEWVLGRDVASTLASREPWPLGEDVRSLLLAPVPGRGAPLGALVLGVPFEEDRLSTFQTSLVEVLCRQVGFVLQNIRLSEHIQNLGNLFDNILESVPHALIATGTDDVILATNKNAEFMFGFKRIVALGERYQDVLPARVSGAMSSIIVRALTGEKMVDWEFEHELPDGTPITVGLTASLLYDRDFMPRGVVFLCRDMTLSREVQKLRELDRMKNEFVQTVSHELKTPLTTIVGGADILMMDREQLSDEHVEVLEIITGGAHRLQALISDLLDLSRLESGDRIHLELERVDIRKLIEGSVEVSRGEGAHEFHVEVADDLPVLFADRAKLKQVFDNVISNAVKYSPGGGKVMVRARSAEDEIYVEVTDEGMGIDAKHLPYIFDKFYRADSSSTAEIEGTGLGLPIARHIMELHGGEITATSTPGEGSIFTIIIPTKTKTILS